MSEHTSYAMAITGPKGGVGKTTFTINLAQAYARQSRGKVLIIDFDLQDCGDVELLLGLSNVPSMYDYGPNLHKMNEKEVIASLKSTKEGLFVLPAVRKTKHIANLQDNHVTEMLQILRKHFQYIFIDCGTAIYPVHVRVLEVCSLVLFCLTPDLLPIHRSTTSIQVFEELAFPSDMVQLVINEYDPKGPIPAKVIEQKLKRSIIGTLTYQPKEHAQSVQQAKPLTLLDPRAPYSQDIETILRKLVTGNLLKPIQDHKLASSTGMHEVTSLQQGSAQGRPKGIQKVLNKEVERMDAIRVKIHQELINRMDFKQLSAEELMKQDDVSLDRLRQKTHEMILSIVSNMPEIQDRQQRQSLITEVLNEAVGLGPLEYMLADESISEIMVNRCDQIYVEKGGKLTLSGARFSSDKQLMGVIERIVAPIGRQINEKTPMVDARLRDGSRVHAIIPPLALDGPILTIRKFSTDLLGPKELIGFGAMTGEMADFLRACVQAHLNVVISGGTGTGKTTLLNALASFIPNHERIITVEDSAELQLPQEHIGRLESRPANLKGEGAIPIRELIRNTLRMRPDRIIVGECRGAEALDMLQAMNTGHDGSMTTLHSNSPKDCISRLETLVMFAGMDLPSKAIRDQIASAVTLIVQLSRLGDGSRKITSITEVTGMEAGEIMLQEIYTFKEQGMDANRKVQGQFMATGLVPTFAKKFEQKGIALPKGLLNG